MASIKFKGLFTVTCYDKDGNFKWKEENKNLIVNEGLYHILDVIFTSAAQTDPWYTGLCSASPSPSAADTMASHSGWVEFTDYDEATRPEFSDSRTLSQVDNDGSEAEFTINVDSSTVGGAFLTSDNTVGGSSGTLLCASAFTAGNRAVNSGDTLKVEYQFSASSS